MNVFVIVDGEVTHFTCDYWLVDNGYLILYKNGKCSAAIAAGRWSMICEDTTE